MAFFEKEGLGFIAHVTWLFRHCEARSNLKAIVVGFVPRNDGLRYREVYLIYTMSLVK